MPDVKPMVALTNVNADNMSRHDLLKWVNSTVNGQYKKIEELCSGVAYCQMVEMLFPKSIAVKKIKTSAKMDLDYIHNLKLLQNAFTRLKFDKSIPIDRLCKGKMQDNLEFLQWFKRFYDTQCGSGIVPQALQTDHESPIQTNEKKAITNLKGSANKENNASELDVDSEAYKEKVALEKEYEELKLAAEAIQKDTEFYYSKLVKIEKSLNEALLKQEEVEFCNKALELLYASNSEDGTLLFEKEK